MTRARVAQLRLFQLVLWIQRFALWILTGLLFGLGRPREEPKSILLLRTGAVGDFLFAIPSFSILRKRFPAARIVLLTISTASATDRQNVEKYAGVNAYPWLSFVVPSLIDDVIALRSTHPKYLFREVRPVIQKLNPSMTFILVHPGEWVSSILKKLIFLWLLGVRGNVYGWRTRANYRFMRAIQYEAGLLQHKVMGPLNAVMECPQVPKIQEEDIRWAIQLNAEASTLADMEWTRRGWDSKLVIAFAPGALRAFKAWPAESYIQLGQWLLTHPRAVIVVLGTNLDVPVAAEVCAALGNRCVNLAGEGGVHFSAALMKKCRFLVANDGGAVHLATSVGCPCVTISNENEYPGSVEPWFSKEYAVRNHVPCGPCYAQLYCPEGHCLCVKGIRVEQVMEKCVALCGDVYQMPSLS
jgi:ADP-heptose:LPS heptosyltransferase